MAMRTYEVPQCEICLELLVENQAAIPCGHIFHQICINNWINQRSHCPKCRKACHFSDILCLNFQIECKKPGLYESWVSELGAVKAKEVEELHNKILTLASNLEEEQGKVLHRNKEIESLNKQIKAAQFELSEENKRKCEIEANFNQLRKDSEASLQEHKKCQKTIDSLSAIVEKLTKENSALSHAAEILKTVTGEHKTTEHIKHVRKTARVDVQAKEFYELCLALTQKVDNFKQTLTEYRLRAEDAEKKVQHLTYDIKELKKLYADLRRLKEQERVRSSGISNEEKTDDGAKATKESKEIVILKANEKDSTPKERKVAPRWTVLGDNLRQELNEEKSKAPFYCPESKRIKKNSKTGSQLTLMKFWNPIP